VFIEAPTDQIDAVLKKHGTVRELVDNGWVHLFALAPGGRSCFRRTGEGLWVT